MYGKIFESIFDSTLVADGGWMPTYVFMSMIVLADKDGIVDVAPKALYRRLGFREYDNKISYSDFEAALAYLQEPDDESRSSVEDGRRLIPLAELPDVPGNRGYLIVNYPYYRDRAGREDRAQQSTIRTRRWRERKNTNKNNDETQGDALGRVGRHTDTDTDINTSPPVSPPSGGNGRKRASRLPDDFELTEKRRLVAEAEKLPAERTFAKFSDYWRAASGARARKHDWDATWRNWCRTEADRSSGTGGGKRAPTDPYYDEIREAVANAEH